MKILAINNYDLEWVFKEKGKVPAQHSWGVDYLRRKGLQVDTHIWKIPSIYYRLFKNKSYRAYKLTFFLYLLVRWYKYESIITFFSDELCLSVLIRMKKMGVIKAKLYTIVHHSGIPKDLLETMDGCIFLSSEIYKKSYKNFKLKNVSFLWWGADAPFYERTYNVMNLMKKRFANPIIVSNGDTNRDHSLLVDACLQSGVNCLIFDSNIKSNARIKTTPRAGYIDMLKRIRKCAIMAVPVINLNQNTIQCIRGFNSIIDGMILGMPIIISDNCNLPFNIDELGIGLTYKGEDVQSLKEKILFMTQHPEVMEEMGRRAREFALKNDYLKYCTDLYQILTS